MSETDAAAELTIDELARDNGLTVRTTRYYASLGLLPPPERRGRIAVYGAQHSARLELLTTLQDHGYTLSAIEKILLDIPMTASPDEISLQRSMLTAWRSQDWESLSVAEIEELTGRTLSPAVIDWLVKAGSLVADVDGRFLTLPSVGLALDLYDAEFPLELVQAANETVQVHMDALAEELAGHMTRWLTGLPDPAHTSPEEAARRDAAIAALRSLALDAIVIGYKRAHHKLVTRTLTTTDGK